MPLSQQLSQLFAVVTTATLKGPKSTQGELQERRVFWFGLTLTILICWQPLQNPTLLLLAGTSFRTNISRWAHSQIIGFKTLLAAEAH